jgi:serine/threonine protein kinase
MPVEIAYLPFLHKKILLKDLGANLKLLSNEKIEIIQNILKDKEDGTYSKHYFDSIEPGYTPYAFMKLDNEYYIKYKGEKHDCHIAIDKHKTTKIKLVQQAETGEWFILKVITAQAPAVKINYSREKLGEFVVDVRATEEQYQEVMLEYQNLKNEIVNQAQGYVHYRSAKNNSTKFYLLQKLIQGEQLLGVLSRQYKLNDIRWLEIAIQWLSIVRSLHSKEYLHCDIKPNNIVYNTNTGTLAMVDFRSLIKMDKNGLGIQTLQGTGLFLAPEFYQMFKDNNNNDSAMYTYSQATEIFALGASLKVLFHLPIKATAGPGRPQPNDEFFYVGAHKTLSHHPAIKKALNAMTDDDFEKRPCLNTTIAEFQKIYDEIILKVQMKVGIIAVDEFIPLYNQSPQIEKKRMIDCLKLFDEIYFINKLPKPHDLELLELQKILNANRVVYHNVLFVTDNIYSDAINSIYSRIRMQVDKRAVCHTVLIDFSTLATKNSLTDDETNNRLYLLKSGVNVLYYHPGYLIPKLKADVNILTRSPEESQIRFMEALIKNNIADAEIKLARFSASDPQSYQVASMRAIILKLLVLQKCVGDLSGDKVLSEGMLKQITEYIGIVKKKTPSIFRLFDSNAKVVKFEPVKPTENGIGHENGIETTFEARKPI